MAKSHTTVMRKGHSAAETARPDRSAHARITPTELEEGLVSRRARQEVASAVASNANVLQRAATR
jgi:hypothetical protein